jgi:tetratricopeptide (TPR) repeat protein
MPAPPTPRNGPVAPAAGPTSSRPRRQWGALAVLLAILLGVGGWTAWVHGSAWAELRRGRADIDGDPAAARAHLEWCLETWPNSAEAHFLAGQAARLSGELPAARRHLDTAARLGWDATAVEVEQALVEVQDGHLDRVEPVLMSALANGYPDARHIVAILVPAYMAAFRWPEADVACERWAGLEPGSALAWAARGEILERLRKLDPAVAAYRRAVELAPDDRAARLNLARLLIETKHLTGEPEEHLERLATADPDNPAVGVYLAVCREAQGKVDEAAALLDRVTAANPRDPKAFHYRGRIELNRGRPAAALGYLRRAAELDRSDPEVLYTLFQCVQQTGTPEEVRAAEGRWKQANADLKRVSELGRRIAAAPHDADLRCEIGELFLRHGRDTDGLRWLESALRERADHAGTHRALAAYYARVGRPDLAARHGDFGGPRRPAE